jgi:excisionase family DNA binding protein
VEEHFDPNAEWLTPKEAAALMGVSVRTIYSWMGRGDLTTTRDNRNLRISRADLEVMHQRKHIRKVAGEIINDTDGDGGGRKPELNNAVFVALAGLQSERQQLSKQVGELQTQLTKEAYEKGQLEEKLQVIGDLEEVVKFIRTENGRLQETNKKLLNTLTVLGIAFIVLAFMLVVCIMVVIR